MNAGASTVVALATPPGRAALAVVRLSGPQVPAIRDRVCRRLSSLPWRPGRTRRVELVDEGGVFDDAVAVWQRPPRSYTGEHTLEISLHGNPLLVERLIAACVDAGARLAGPGAFTRRAVLAGKLSLVEAESVDLTIRSTSTAGVAVARAAPRLVRRVGAFRDELVELIAELEARLDYPDDELALIDDRTLVERLERIGAEAERLASSYRVGRLLVEGARVALVGEVNAGKSALFNRLLGRRRALVSERPGTTRDVVEASSRLGALVVTLLDTAGERETADPLEAEGQALGRELVQTADLLLWVRRADRPPQKKEERIAGAVADRPHLVVYNQVDRGRDALPHGALGVSARTGEGVEQLREALERALIGRLPDPESVVGSLRQAELLRQLGAACRSGIEALVRAGVAVAITELLEGVEAVDALTGADTREEVLDALFERFCIGK